MADSGAPIIVKKIKKGGHGGHHGGAWKVAYADFVTAMMAFFLLLWLLNVTTEDQKNGIADYFTPSTASNEVASGAGDILGGATITVPGSSVSESSPISISDPVATEGTTQAEVEEETEEEEENPETAPPPSPQPAQPTEDQIDKALQEREQKMFDQVAQELQQAIQNVPELAGLAKSLIIDQTPEGLRIQLVDQEGYSMFPRGSAIPQGRTKELIGLVAKAVSSLPNKLSISGHTDSTPYINGNYSNWELSSDRANAARREMLGEGVDETRLATVVGRADRDPLFKDNTEDPRNRRLSIILMRQAPAGQATPQTAPEPAGEPTEAP